VVTKLQDDRISSHKTHVFLDLLVGVDQLDGPTIRESENQRIRESVFFFLFFFFFQLKGRERDLIDETKHVDDARFFDAFNDLEERKNSNTLDDSVLFRSVLSKEKRLFSMVSSVNQPVSQV